MSPRQQQLVQFIAAHKAATGINPSYHEMREALSLKSLTFLRKTLNALERKGVVARRFAGKRTVELRA